MILVCQSGGVKDRGQLLKRIKQIITKHVFIYTVNVKNVIFSV